MKGFVLAVALFTATLSFANDAIVDSHSYAAKDYSHLLGMKGFTDRALNLHFGLYRGYVKNTNRLLNELNGKRLFGTPQYNELKRRLGWEFNGMRLHEYYFENLGGKEPINVDGPLYKAIVKKFGNFDAWKEDFIASGGIRGIGWVILMKDPRSDALVNSWIDEHATGLFAGGRPLLVMDMFEHAYLPDYDTDRSKYMEAFFDNIDWSVVEKRFMQTDITPVSEK